MENTILKDIIDASKTVKECKLSNKVLKSKEACLLRIEEHFKITRIQNIILIVVFELNSTGLHPNQADLAKHLKCNPMQFYVYRDEILALHRRGFFKAKRNHFTGVNDVGNSLVVSKELRTSLLENTPFIKRPDVSFTSLSFIENIKTYFDSSDDNEISAAHLRVELKIKMTSNSDQPIVKYFNKLKISTSNLLAFIYIIAKNIDGETSCEIPQFSKGLFDDKSKRIRYETTIEDGTNELLKYDYLDFKESNFFSSATVSLTEKAKVELEPFDVPLRVKNKSKEINLILPSQISKKRMFYSAFAKAEMETITNSLKPLKYRQITNSLKAEGFQIGICALFYGAPGTGKTEGVYQIAKTTGRAIWKVDLSDLKSMWYGESQKLVKALFKDYKKLCEKEKKTPILLLNEADAILGKRSTDPKQSTDKVDNAIQNIFLDCLEDFEGILFATTNLEESLDSAFERRFLFKVNFKRPDVNARKGIWKSKLKGVPKKVVDELATRFDLSGGEIDNVVRKFKMIRALNPKVDSYIKLIDLCEGERLSKSNEIKKIGFSTI